MSNSPLVEYTALSPNCSARTGKIDRITIHHMAGVGTVESCGEIFAAPARQASANYGIGNDGRIGLYVPEDKRAWTSSSTANDNRAVTIEVSNSEARYPWPVSAAAYAALIDLCVDICRRNGIKRLNYTGDTSGNLTMHCWFAATACPGQYLKERFPAIAAEVNQRLEELSMTGKDIIEKLSDAEAYELLQKAQHHAEKLPLPTSWDAAGAWQSATAHGITDGTRPMALATRLEAAVQADRARE